MPERKLADRIRDAIRMRGYSIRTGKACLHWYERFVRFHKLRHLATIGASEVEAFLTYLRSLPAAGRDLDVAHRRAPNGGAPYIRTQDGAARCHADSQSVTTTEKGGRRGMIQASAATEATGICSLAPWVCF